MIRLPASFQCAGRCAGVRLCAVSLACLLVAWTAAVAAVSPTLKIPAGDASRTLRQFSRQAGVQLVFPADEVQGHRTNEVSGQLEPRQALDLLLRGSGLGFVEDASTGAFLVRREAGGAIGPAATPREAASDLLTPASGAAARAAEEGEIVLSPFEIQTRADRGYRPANSVSATRIVAPIRNLPMSVSAFTEEFIADQKPYDLYDVVKWTPGVHQDNVSPQGWVRYAVRGFTAASIQRNGFGSFRFIDTTNIARVEVVKGPYSLLYGQINPGGVINYVTKRPESRPAFAASASIGTDGYGRVVLDATGPVDGTAGTVLARTVAMAESIQRFKRGYEGHKLMLAPSVQWKVNERISLVLEVEHFERREDGLTSGVPLIYVNGVATRQYPGLPWDFSYAGEGDFQNFTSNAVTFEAAVRLGEDLHLRLAWLDSDWDMEWRASGQGGTGHIKQSTIDYYYPPSAGLTPRDAMIRRNRWEHQWGDERSLQIDLTGDYPLGAFRLKPLVGLKRTFEIAQRSQQKNNSTTPGAPTNLPPWDLRDPATWDRRVPFGIDALIPVADISMSSSGTSLYGVLSMASCDETWHLLAGYALHEVASAPTSDVIAGTVMPAATRSRSVPQIGALHRIDRHLSAFATYSESFLANPTLLRINNAPGAPAVPSVGRGWEAGLKIEGWYGRVSGTVSTYAIRARPAAIITVTSGVDANGTTLFTDIQGGAQESTGFEAEFFVAPVPGLELYASVGTCDATYRRHPTNPALDGARLVAAPDRMASIWAKYTFRKQGAARWFLTAGANHVGTMAYVGNNPAAILPAYTTVDAGVGCTFRVLERSWTADLLVKNLTDRHYYASNSSWGFPRHAIATVSTRF